MNPSGKAGMTLTRLEVDHLNFGPRSGDSL